MLVTPSEVECLLPKWANNLFVRIDVNVIDDPTDISLELTTTLASRRTALPQHSRTNATELHLNITRAVHLHIRHISHAHCLCFSANGCHLSLVIKVKYGVLLAVRQL